MVGGSIVIGGVVVGGVTIMHKWTNVIGGVVVGGVTIMHKWTKKHTDNKSRKFKYRLKEKKVKNKGEKCLIVRKSRRYY